MLLEKIFILKYDVASLSTPPLRTCIFVFKVHVNTHAYSNISVSTDTYKNRLDDIYLLRRYHQKQIHRK